MKKIGVRMSWLAVALGLGASFTPPTLAQTLTTGAVQGYVFEAGTMAPIAGAQVTVTNQETGLLRSTVAGADGFYFIGILPVGIYIVAGSHPGYEQDPSYATNNFPVRLAKTNVVQPPPIVLRKIGAAQMAAVAMTAPPATSPGQPANDSEIERLVNTVNGTRGGNFDRRQLTSLPLSGIRTFDALALLLPGVAPPPQPVGNTVGPGIGPGVGTSGQFSANGLRSRSNNFTVDGSDNNDEDVGVRRQGFVALTPQSIESVQEYQVFTQLWDGGVGRNLGSQVNAVSRSGSNQVHGAFYDFFNHQALNARDFFDYTSDKASQFPLTAQARLTNGTVRTVPVTIDDRPVVERNPSEDRDPYQRHQAGASIGFPLAQNKALFFGSFERQEIKARQETHFAVPAVAQRGFLNSGATGFFAPDRAGRQQVFFPTFIAGDAVFSLFPFPNNPVGPYGENTFTQVLPADADGTIFSLKFDCNFKLFGSAVAHTLTGRYNFTQDRRQIPSVGGAIFAGLEPRVRAQNLSLFLSSQLTTRVSNQIRISYGRTRLRFDAVRNPLTRPSQAFPANPFLLNARRLVKVSFPGNDVRQFGLYTAGTFDTESNLGPVGQLVVTPFSPVGLDTSLFPQARTTNTYQFADTATAFRGPHTFKFGGDFRRTHLNSFLDRNFRPQVVFGGTADLTGSYGSLVPIPNLSQRGPTPGFFSGADLAALGVPTGIFQALAIGTPDSTIGLRFWQYNFFFNDTWRLGRGLSLDYGLRYEYNTVPREVNNRIEKTFGLDLLPAVDPSLGVGILSRGVFVPQDTAKLTSAFNQTLGALKNFLGGRQTIYDPDRNNFGPRVGFAWDPFVGSQTQAGKTAVRGGAGVYYDVALGSIVSQSRNVFPTFVPFNVDANTFFYANDQFY